MFKRLCGAVALTLQLTSVVYGAPVPSGWIFTGQTLSSVDSASQGMDNFPSALAASGGHVLASDIWPASAKISEDQVDLLRARVPHEGGSEIVGNSGISSLYRYDINAAGQFSDGLVTFIMKQNLGYSLSLQGANAFVGAPSSNTVYFYQRDKDGYSLKEAKVKASGHSPLLW